MDLALPTSSAENNEIIKFWKRKSSAYWIGANDQKQEGVWVDSSGRPVTFLNFRPSEPNGGSRENCIDGSNGWAEAVWNDLD